MVAVDGRNGACAIVRASATRRRCGTGGAAGSGRAGLNRRCGDGAVTAGGALDDHGLANGEISESSGLADLHREAWLGGDLDDVAALVGDIEVVAVDELDRPDGRATAGTGGTELPAAGECPTTRTEATLPPGGRARRGKAPGLRIGACGGDIRRAVFTLEPRSPAE